MDGIDLPDFESLDDLPSTLVSDVENAGAGDEFSDDPDQLWFDETVTTMFMEDADKPKMDTVPVEPRMETKAWPPGVIAEGIEEAFTASVEKAETVAIETAAQLESEGQIPSAPTTETFLVTAKDEVDAGSGTDAAPVPVKPRPIDDVPAPGQALPFAAMLDSASPVEGGKRGLGVKLAPGWKPLRGQKLNPSVKAAAAADDADADDDGASGAGQELVAATLRTPRQDSILDGFGQFLEEQVILSAAIDEPAFKALAPSFDGSDAEPNSPDTEWQPTTVPPQVSAPAQPEAEAKPESLPSVADGGVVPENPSAAAPRVKTEWVNGPLAGGEESLPKPVWPAEAPTDAAQNEPDRDVPVAAEPAEKSAEQRTFPADNADRSDPDKRPSAEESDNSKQVPVSAALPKSTQPISAPPLVAGDQPRGFSASLLYGVEPAGSFFDDLGKEDPAASNDQLPEKAEKADAEKAEASQSFAAAAAAAAGSGADSKPAFPEAIDSGTVDPQADNDSERQPSPETAGSLLPWGKIGSEVEAEEEEEAGADAFAQADSSVADSAVDEIEAPVTVDDEDLPTAAESSEVPASPRVDDIPVSALGYSHSRTNPALIKHGVTCPACGVNLQIQARYLNIEGKCPGCSEMIVARQRGVVEPVAELATGRFPSFDCQPDIEPGDVAGGTVLNRVAAHGSAGRGVGVPPAQGDPPPAPVDDPFSNPQHALKKVREAAAGGVWGATSSKGLS